MNGNASWLSKDFYKVLGVGEGATADEIKRAYRKIARKSHPDRNPGDRKAEETMKDASEAYDVLSDPKKRTEYDETRRMGRGGFRGGGFPGGGTTLRVEDLGNAGFDVGDLFGGLFGGAGRGGRRRGPARGVDLETEVRIPFEDAVSGATVPVRVRRAVCHRRHRRVQHSGVHRRGVR